MGLIHEQLRARRRQLGLKQKDMQLRTGMPRQQYHRLETDGNPRLSTLELAAAGLGLALVLIPKEKLHAVKSVLREAETGAVSQGMGTSSPESLSNPWAEIFTEDDYD